MGAIVLLAPALASSASASSASAGSPRGALHAATMSRVQDPVGEALAHEDGKRWVAAAASYRQVLARALEGTDASDQIALALLGLERAWHEAGLRDSIVPVVNEVLRRRPTDPVARSIQFRALSTASRETELQAAFMEWRRAASGDAAPWREYIRTLMAMGRSALADTVLAEAERALGRRSELVGEAAQIAATLERWHDAAVSWRRTVDAMPWMEMAAAFSLQRTPVASRDSVRTVLAAPPVTLLPRRLLAALETGWGEPRRGWAALTAVRGDDSTLVAWREFGDGAEAMGAWSVARDVWRALFERTNDPKAGARAARAALSAGEPAVALELAARAGREQPAAERARHLLAIEVAALGELGRPADAARRVADAETHLDDALRAELARALVGAWLRAGDVERARDAATRADVLDDDQVIGWLALYDGDLAEARRRLVRAITRDAALTDALAILARTRAPRHPGLGAAFLALARRDTAEATARFAALADSLPDAAPALLATAARLGAASGNGTLAVRYWEQVAAQHGSAPELPEALLELARAAVRAGDTASAAARYESLLIDHSGSAMVPQARRELERLRSRVPERR